MENNKLPCHLASLILIEEEEQTPLFMYVAAETRKKKIDSENIGVPFETFSYKYSSNKIYRQNNLFILDTVDSIIEPAFMVSNSFDMIRGNCEINSHLRQEITFTSISLEFLLRDRWGLYSLNNTYFKLGFKMSEFDRANELDKNSMLESMIFRKITNSIDDDDEDIEEIDLL